jgi:hypothetical protein
MTDTKDIVVEVKMLLMGNPKLTEDPTEIIELVCQVLNKQFVGMSPTKRLAIIAEMLLPYTKDIKVHFGGLQDADI